jgi:dienelactone hydrolase
MLAASLFLLAQSLPGTQPLNKQGDLAARMLAGIDAWLDFETFNSAKSRPNPPRPDGLRKILGVVDERAAFTTLSPEAALAAPAEVHTGPAYRVRRVRWPVLAGLDAQGLLFDPAGTPKVRIVALPDADQAPEQIEWPHRLAASGCQVIVVALVDRAPAGVVNPLIPKKLNQSRREFLYREAFEMGRHIIGFEVQKTLAAVDWFARQQPQVPVAVAGYAEGGLIALHSAALDSRISTALISGYFGPREQLWREPVYRNVWGLLNAYGDADIAAMIAPRRLLIEPARTPETPGRAPDAAPGVILTPNYGEVHAEVERAKLLGANIDLITDRHGRDAAFTDSALAALLAGWKLPLSAATPAPRIAAFTRSAFEDLHSYIQGLVRGSGAVRAKFWANADPTSPEKWKQSIEPYRRHFRDEVIGRLPRPSEPLTSQTRMLYDKPKWKGHEVVLPLFPEVFAYGILLVPADLKAGEKRPVVVAQHGRGGRPQELIEPSTPRAESVYKHFAAQLADLGYVVYVPQNPYIFEEQYRMLQRKANPLKLSLFSFIAAQHERHLEWLASLPFVDADRIAYYGLSYGGKTASRIPPLLDRYALCITSGDFGEYIGKMASSERPESFLFTTEHEMYEFDLGNTFNYGELAMMMAPRPFMVERGHNDPVGFDNWVAHEYARVRRFYNQMGIGDRTTIEFFDGVHEINAKGTFEFLRRHLGWPR